MSTRKEGTPRPHAHQPARRHRDQSSACWPPSTHILPLASRQPLQSTTRVRETRRAFLPSAFPQCAQYKVLGSDKQARPSTLSSKYFYSATGHCASQKSLQSDFILLQDRKQLTWMTSPLTSSLSLTDTLRVESEAVADVRDPLRPSSRFSLLASVSITATFPLKDRPRAGLKSHL